MQIRFDSRVQCTLSVLVIGLLVVRFVLPANADDTIRISISNTGGAFSVAGIALKKGFFEKEHLNVELIQMRGNVSMNALYTGAIDYTILFGSVFGPRYRVFHSKCWQALSTDLEMYWSASPASSLQAK